VMSHLTDSEKRGQKSMAAGRGKSFKAGSGRQTACRPPSGGGSLEGAGVRAGEYPPFCAERTHRTAATV
jgi:hypothetical protein